LFNQEILLNSKLGGFIMYYVSDEINVDRLKSDGQLILINVAARFVENLIISNRSKFIVCIHNKLLKDDIFRKFSYLQILPLRNSIPMTTNGDIIFIVDAADPKKTYIMVQIQ